MLLIAASPLRGDASSPETACRGWLIERIEVRPSTAASFAQTLAGSVRLMLVSHSQHVTLFSSAPDDESAERSGHRGAGDQTWRLFGSMPPLAPNTSAHLGLWFAETTEYARVRAALSAWQANADAETRIVLLPQDNDPAGVFLTLAAGDESVAAGFAIATQLAPFLRRAIVDLGHVTRGPIDPPSSVEGPSSQVVAAPLTPLPAPSGDGSEADDPRDSDRSSAEKALVEDADDRHTDLDFGQRLAIAARQSVTRAPRYDTGYRAIAFPGGDPGWDIGSGVDVIIRALRALDIDLQVLVSQDIQRAPDVYGYVGREPDTSIAHRRIRNLATFLDRWTARLGPEAAWQEGDLVLWDVLDNGRPAHVGIVSRSGPPDVWLIHHFRDEPPFTGVPSEDTVLEFWPLWGHFRIEPERIESEWMERSGRLGSP